MTKSARPLRIVGYGGHGLVIAEIARALGDIPLSFLDDRPGEYYLGIPIERPTSELLKRTASTHRFVVGIGDAAARRRVAEEILEVGGELATLVHPSAIIASDVLLGVGTVVMAGAIVNPGARVGRFAIINTGAIVDHDSVIEDNVQICPGCTLAGNVKCRMDAFVGSGATIIPGIEVGQGSLVAAGATVIRDVLPYTMVAGCPATERRSL